MSEIDQNVSTPAVSDIAATPAPAIPQGTPAAPPTAATPNVGSQPPATGGVPEGYVPSYRLREIREQAQREYQSREAALQAKYDALDRQVKALVGVTPPQHPEQDEIRTQFEQLYPQFPDIYGQADQIKELMELKEQFKATMDHYWSNHGRSTMDRLFDQASTSLGSPLSDDAKRVLYNAFAGMAQSSPELTERYANDPALATEFWKAFQSSFIDPIRRTTTAGVANRIPSGLPQDSPGGAPQSSPAPKLNGLDERANATWALFNATKQGG